MEQFTDALTIFMVFSIPLLAIFLTYKGKMKKMELQHSNQNQEEVNELKRQIGHLFQQQELLEERIAELESHGSTEQISLSIEELDILRKADKK